MAAEQSLQKGYAFEAESTERALREWCAANEIELVEDGSDPIGLTRHFNRGSGVMTCDRPENQGNALWRSIGVC